MSDLLLLILSLAWAALAVGFLTSAGRVYRHREQLPMPATGGSLPSVSVIVPARDEAENIGECLECITRLEYPDSTLEVIVVDDHSGDATAGIAGEHAARDSRIRLIASAPLAEGWTGKSHACWQGVHEATGEWLLFVDADTFLAPGALRAALSHAVAEGLEFLSVSPFQRIVSPGERLVLPGIFLRFASAIDFRRVNDPDDPFAIANGQFLLFRRAAYERIGGHAAIRGEVSDDLAFARAAKRHRLRARTLFGEALMETRMYRSVAGVWHGFSKNAMEIMHADSPAPMAGAAAVSFGLAAGPVLPLLALPAGSPLQAVALAVSLVTLVTLALFSALALRAMRVPLAYVAALPLGLAMHGAIMLNAYARGTTRSRQWKGRRY